MGHFYFVFVVFFFGEMIMVMVVVMVVVIGVVEDAGLGFHVCFGGAFAGLFWV